MKLSICIVHYYQTAELQQFLESLADYPPHCLYEVLIVDNGSEGDEIKQLSKRLGDHIHVITPGKNLGFGKAMNKAVKKARGEYVFLANPDLEFQDASLKRLFEHLEKHPKAGIVGPQLISPDESLQHSVRSFPSMMDLVSKRLGMSKDGYLLADKELNKHQTVDWMVGAAMLMKKELFEDLKGFDERFFLFFEDTDLCRRVWEQGKEVWYCPSAQMIHSSTRLSQRGLWVFKKVFWIHLSSALKYFWKWRGKEEKKQGSKELNI